MHRTPRSHTSTIDIPCGPLHGNMARNIPGDQALVSTGATVSTPNPHIPGHNITSIPVMNAAASGVNPVIYNSPPVGVVMGVGVPGGATGSCTPPPRNTARKHTPPHVYDNLANNWTSSGGYGGHVLPSGPPHTPPLTQNQWNICSPPDGQPMNGTQRPGLLEMSSPNVLSTPSPGTPSPLSGQPPGAQGGIPGTQYLTTAQPVTRLPPSHLSPKEMYTSQTFFRMSGANLVNSPVSPPDTSPQQHLVRPPLMSRPYQPSDVPYSPLHQEGHPSQPSTPLVNRVPSRTGGVPSEDTEYTQALLTFQKDRMHKLLGLLEESLHKLDYYRSEVSKLDKQRLSQGPQNNAPFPSAEDLAKVKEENRNLSIKIQLLAHEIDMYGQNQLGVIAPGAGCNFYTNIAPGQHGSVHTPAGPGFNQPAGPGSIQPAGPGSFQPAVSTVPPGGWQPLDPPPTSVSDSSVTRRRTPPPRPPPPFTHNPPAVHRPTVAQRPASPPGEEAQWRCSACTFDNHHALNKCEVCEMPRVTTTDKR